jgi:formate dehydrogenase subunit delta
MDAHKLVKMANEIAAFFTSDPDPRAVSDGIAGHIRRFWDPRMRRALLAHIDDHAGEGCTPAVLAAVTSHREQLAPPAS